ncbi:hypothetical protein KS4_00870 [Poriferisphaera corsica]|uniref:Glycosyltransferase subfamily 4-like N-terminal domain-containing protein n=1 Tax=Poriferisphaera corsica TaxID=2528020 RepID=A0A517YPB5_9BACT|nr:glycosyltransferase [Poriferisphaera corsica]QDU32059.1 hypothetical protein KS4_00870 [Poriferisphaera corsica]
MRLLILTGRIEGCGIGMYAKHLAAHLSRVGVDVVLGCVGDGKGGWVSDEDGVRVVRIDVRRGVGMWDVLDRWKPEVVHIQYPSSESLALYLFYKALKRFYRRVPIVTTLHERPNSWRVWPIVWGAKVVISPRWAKLMWGWKIATMKRMVHIANASMLPSAKVGRGGREKLREKWGVGKKKLVLSFGFLTPANETELLFQICDVRKHRLVVSGRAFEQTEAYHAALRDRCGEYGWDAAEVFCGYLDGQRLSDLMEVSDAIVLPYRDGGDDWNTSLLAAMEHETFKLTTSKKRRGYESETNTYYARIGDLDEMKKALERYIGVRGGDVRQGRQWEDVASEHMEVYGRYMNVIEWCEAVERS